MHRLLWSALAAATVLAVLFLHGLPLVPTGSVGQDGASVIPDPFPDYSHLASPVQGNPVGPVLMVFAYGQGVELMDLPTVVALGADGTTYRHLRGADSDTRPFLIAPDGTAVAVGTTGAGGRLRVIDLLTGDHHRWTVRKGSAVYDTDSSRSAATSLPSDPVTESTVAALPDGDGLLVGTGGVTELRDADGANPLVTDVRLPRGRAASWVSPDGLHVAAQGDSLDGPMVAVYGLEERQAAQLPTVEHTGLGATALGWLDDRRLLVGTTLQDTRNHFQLWSLDAVSGEKERVLLSDPGWTGASVTSVSMAGDLLQGASIQPVDDTDRGNPVMILRTLAWLFLLPLAHQLWTRRRPRDRWGAAI